MEQRRAGQPINFTRRRMLSAVSALSVLSLSQWPIRALAKDLDFLALSEKLTTQKGLSKDIAGAMHNAYSAIHKQDALDQLAAGGENADLANAVVASWYTGESPDPDSLSVLTYTDALIWTAMDYTKPMAYCGGETGYWADPPEA